MARLAYVKETDRLKTYLEKAGFQLGAAIGYETGGTQAFIAEDRANKLTVVAFRGTEPDDPSDLFTDAKFLQDEWRDATDRSLGQVHRGFAQAAFEKVARKNPDREVGIFPELKRLIDAQSPGQRLLLTGHSLGAAMATLMASWAPHAHLYTFGSPRVGDTAFVQSLKNPVKLRVVNCCDAVTRVPPDNVPGLDYQHAGTLEYIDRNGKRLGAADESTINEDRIQGAAHYLFHDAFLRGTVSVREFADHAPINYVSGIMGTRTSA
jgi:hypothetical protein